jgi:deazaflavin-dependent oxidoreductase (nitroreductase family)
MPSDELLHAMNRLHRGLLRVTGGMLGWRLKGMPVLELTTIGRKSGLAHAVMLTAPIRDGDAFVVVASRGGDERHPSWFLNLIEHPDVKVKLDGWSEQTMRARVVPPGDRDALWARVTNAYSGYAGYQEKTARVIPLVVLEPAAPAST